MSTDEQERRQFFRIDDYVRLSYSVITDLRSLPGDAADTPRQTRGEMQRELEAEFNSTLNALWRDYPLAAKALSQLNRKLDLLGDAASSDLEDSAVGEKPTRVNISGSGIAFRSDTMFPAGQLLDLDIVLLPSESPLRIMARVVDSDMIPGADQGDPRPYLVRAEFALRDSAAQETLISHIVQREHAQRAERHCETK